MLIDRYAQFRVFAENLSKNLHKYENAKMSSLGMRGIHALSLFHLGRSNEGMTVTELAAACEVDKALISRVTDELIEGGNVTYKDPDKKNYRSKLVLTHKGRACLRRVTLWICDSIRELKDEISREELNAFFHVIEVLNKYFIAESAEDSASEEN